MQASQFYRQRGVALIVVLLIVALVAVLATEMGSRLQLQVKRAANIKDANQAYWYALSAEQFARKSLREVFQNFDHISLGQPWDQEFTFPLEGGGIQAKLTDIQGCFNLNAVSTATTAATGNTGGANASGTTTSATNPTPAGSNTGNTIRTNTTAEAFYQLLTKAELNIDSYTAESTRDALVDWLDQDDQQSDFGAEDSEYESRSIPYLAANGQMASKSELRLLNGVEASWLTNLLPYVCVIPGQDQLKININTIDKEHGALLAGLTGLTLDNANDILNLRPQDGYDDVNDFFNEPEVQAANLNSGQQAWFDVTTSYFILYTKSRYNNATFAMSTVFYINEDNQVSVVRREFGRQLGRSI